ncbi:MAG: hypothetical protein Q8P12_03370 [bacterium]|nr:hypothetical protein [bacterium]
MDLKELQRILQKDRGRIIIVEDGKPLMVILPYEEYAGRGAPAAEERDEEPFEGMEEADSGSGELTIEDLPL